MISNHSYLGIYKFNTFSYLIILVAILLNPKIIKRSKHSFEFDNSYQVNHIID